jgi:rubredoxin
MQVSSNPVRLAVSINKANYSHDVIKKTGKLNVNVLSQNAPFSLFQNYGFRSGRDNDKFVGVEFTRSHNGLPILSQHCNAFFSLRVESYTDLDSHGLFLCTITEAATLSADETMTYSYYHANVKPRPAAKKTGYVCTICGYVYDPEVGDPEHGIPAGTPFEELPADWTCPLCKHPTSDFQKLGEEQAAASAPAAPTKTAVGKGTKYVCSVCGYTYDPAVGIPERGIPAGTPFEDLPADWSCPICLQPRSVFQPVEEEASVPTGPRKYVCSICGYVYDPAVGDPERGIPAGTPFEDLPADWTCPLCTQGKDMFKPEE